MYWSCSRRRHPATLNCFHLQRHKWCNSAGHSLAPRPSTGTTPSAPNCRESAPAACHPTVVICSVAKGEGISGYKTPVSHSNDSYLIRRHFLSHHTGRVPTKTLPLPCQFPSLLSVIVEKAAQITQLLVVIPQPLVRLLQDAQLCD